MLLFLYSIQGHSYIDGFQTVPADPVPHGVVHFGLKIGTYSSLNLVDIPLSGKLLLGPMLYFDMGLGDIADFHASWDGYRSLKEDSQFGNTGEWGDPYFHTKLRLLHGQDVPTVAISFGAKEPAASDESHLGTDQADLFIVTHFSKPFLSTLCHINFGLGIYGDQNGLARQKDAVMYSGLVEYELMPGFEMGWELAGQFKESGSDLNRGVMRLGLKKNISQKWDVHLLGSAGFISQSEEWGLLMGIQYSNKILK
ncbi:MAG: hypothetical protein HYS98_02100 [Deltaproteobacteria bacterium]|nr:hypothetical protein [Deltaproteobacteria bacterium]